MKLRRKNVGGVDRISNLPESIIHRIMSLLSPEEVVRTNVLSKKWYHFKASYPVLKFKQIKFNRDPEYLNYFTKVVYKSLHHFSQNKLVLEAFCIEIFSPSLYPDLRSWIELALQNGVKLLDLCFCNHTIPFLPGLAVISSPQPLFSSKTLTNLNLMGCSLDQPLSVFSSLRKLSLQQCRLNGPIILKDNDCPWLEHLVLKACFGVEPVHISNLLRLHTVYVNYRSYFFELVIASQSVQSVYIHAMRQSWSMINIDGCDRLKLLYVMSQTITDRELQSLLSKLILLEELYLKRCLGLKTVKISNTYLKTLQISTEDFNPHLHILEIAAPSLTTFICSVHSKAFRIKVADCCQNLKSLFLFSYLGTERSIHNFISKFPLLENLWLEECSELGSLRVSNPGFKRLYVARCSKLEAVKVESPNLLEFCYTCLEALRTTVVGGRAPDCKSFERGPSALLYYGLNKALGYAVGLSRANLICPPPEGDRDVMYA